MSASANKSNGPASERQVMSQKQAVYSSIQHVLGKDSFEGTDLNRTITSEQRKNVVDLLVEGFKSGIVTLSTDFPSDSALRTYCTGLLSNWLRKDTRLNGGAPYTPKHPGARGRQAPEMDSQLKALNDLLAQVEDEDEKEEIMGYIEARKQKIGQTKVIKNVDFNSLPEALRNKFAAQA